MNERNRVYVRVLLFDFLALMPTVKITMIHQYISHFKLTMTIYPFYGC